MRQGATSGSKPPPAAHGDAKEPSGADAKIKPAATNLGIKGRGKGAAATAAAAASPQGRDAQVEAGAEAARAAAAAEAEATAKAEAQREERRRKGIDKLRGQLQVERERDLAAKQQQAGIGTLEAAQACTAQQLAQSEEQLAKYYSDTLAEAERRYALLSEEQKYELIDEKFW